MTNNLTIAGKQYPVKLGHNALSLFEQQTKISIMEIGDKMSMTAILQLMYIALKEGARKTNQELTIKSFADLCDLADETQGLIEDFSKLMESSLKSVFTKEESEKNQ